MVLSNMTMKKIFQICSVALILVGGCKKNLLDTHPNNQVATSNVWTSDALTVEGVNGVYAALRGGASSGTGDMLYELYSMDRYGITGQDYQQVELTQGTATVNSGLFSTAWQALYEGIARANDAILNIPAKSPSAVTKKGQYVAECKFLRAYFYYRLNQVWQGVPIYLTPTDYNKFNHPKSTADQVWAVIINDLTDAINEPNLPAKYAAGATDYGRVTKGAAYALRGKVYMYQKNWAAAIADFQQVKASGYALYTGAGANSYSQLFKLANEQCPEMIFSMQNMDLAGYGSDIEWYCGTRASFGSCWSYYSGTPYLADLYENADGSKFNWDSVIPGWSSLTPAQREVFFIRDGATPAELAAAANRGAQISLYLPVGNQARVMQAYANRDPRMTQTLITPYSSYQGSGTTYKWQWPFRSAASPNYDIQADNTVGFYYYRKFVETGPSEISARNQIPVDFPIIRYADILLSWAEALNESSGVTQAGLDLVNQVRARAGVALLQNTNSALPTYVSSQDDFRQRIRNERRVEFPNEGVDYFDELRWGTWLDLKFKPGNGPMFPWGAAYYTYVNQGNYITTWPVPNSVVQITNGNVQGTAGWTY
jgi:hypothetical protein